MILNNQYERLKKDLNKTPKNKNLNFQNDNQKKLNDNKEVERQEITLTNDINYKDLITEHEKKITDKILSKKEHKLYFEGLNRPFIDKRVSVSWIK